MEIKVLYANENPQETSELTFWRLTSTIVVVPHR